MLLHVDKVGSKWLVHNGFPPIQERNDTVQVMCSCLHFDTVGHIPLGYNLVQSSLLYIGTLGLLYTLPHFGTQGYTQLFHSEAPLYQQDICSY